MEGTRRTDARKADMDVQNGDNRIEKEDQSYGKTSEALRIDRRVKQGDGLAPTLFNLILEAIKRRANIRRNAMLLHHSYQILGYADDLDIAGRSLKAVKETFEVIEIETKKVGLEINAEKTKFMIIKSQN